MLQNDAIQKFIKDIPGRTNCSASDMYSFVECLRNAPVDVLLQATDFFQDLTDEGIKLDFTVGPSVDGELYPKHPLLLLNDPNSAQAKFFKSLDFIAGTVQQEGSLVYMEVSPQIMERYKFDINEKIPAEFICQGMVKTFVEIFYKNNENIYKTLCDFYTSETDMDRQSVRAADLYADIIFTPATAEILDLHARLGGRTYQYIFSKLGPKRFGPDAPKWFKTNGHGDELMFLFHMDNDGKDGFFDVKMADIDLKISRTTIEYWTSFAKTGIPCTGETGLPWIEYETDKKIYMDFADDISLKQRAKHKTVKFWLEELPKIDLNSPFILHDEL
ncbi:hypothetical protein FSP39_000655 [Pinctada imbricata]|uniref:Carboxylesterase type B domain-containing protein n=1 Tax=Pinctada imbricata TaxID=66713 RepID=A0AA88XE53_PINIB|nr:hypothetical protein FSP39_000655 [Pinctada imbricata]